MDSGCVTAYRPLGPNVSLPGNVRLTLKTELEANSSMRHHGSVSPRRGSQAAPDWAATVRVEISPSTAVLALCALLPLEPHVAFCLVLHIVDPSRPHPRARFRVLLTQMGIAVQAAKAELPAGEL